MENRISRSPVIRESDMTTNTIPLFPLEGRFPTDRQPRISTLPYIRSESFKPNRMGENYVDTTLAPQPTSNVVFVTDTTNAQGASETPSSPLDVTMLAMLGLTMAGAGVMKSQSAQKKQQELAQANAIAQAQLATAKADQVQTAGANWAENQAMQVGAKQAVVTQVTQSQANKDFWVAYADWQKKVREAEQKRREEALKSQNTTKQQSAVAKPIQSSSSSSQMSVSTALLKLLKWGGHFIKNPIETSLALLTGTTLNATGVQLGGENNWLDWSPTQIISASSAVIGITREYQSAIQTNPNFQTTIGDFSPIDIFRNTFGPVELRLGETPSIVNGNDSSLITLPLDPNDWNGQPVYNGFNQLLIQKIETITGSNPDAEGDSGIDDTTILKYNIAQNTELFHWTRNFRADWGEKTGYGVDTNKTIWELLNDGDAIAKLDEYYLADIQANPDDPKNIYGYMYLAQRGVEGGADWFIRNTFLPLVNVDYTQISTEQNTHPNRSIGFGYDPRIQPTNLMINGLHNQYGGIEIDENTGEEITLGTTLPIGVYDNGYPSQYGSGYKSNNEEPDYGANACGPFNVYGVLNYYNRNGRLNTEFLTQAIPAFGDYYDLIGENGYYTGGVTDKDLGSRFVQGAFGLNAVPANSYNSISTHPIQLFRLMALDIPPIVLVGLVDIGNSQPLDGTNNPTNPSYGTIGIHPNNSEGNVSHFVVLSGFSSPRQWESGQQWVRVENPFLNTTEYYTWQDFQNSQDPRQSMFWIDPNSTVMQDDVAIRTVGEDEITQWGKDDNGFPPIPYQPIEAYQIIGGN